LFYSKHFKSDFILILRTQILTAVTSAAEIKSPGYEIKAISPCPLSLLITNHPVITHGRQRRAPPDQQQNERDLRSPGPGSSPPDSNLVSPDAGPGGEGEMGKNQAYKAMQRARLGSSSGAPGAADAPEDGMVGPLPLP
jgi:hypothetical protein